MKTILKIIVCTLIVTMSGCSSKEKVQEEVIEEYSPWQENQKGRKYKPEDAEECITDTWMDIDGKTYHFNVDGYVDVGWYEKEGKKCFLSSDGSMVTGAHAVEDKVYYFEDNGQLTTSDYVQNGKVEYYIKDGQVIETVVNDVQYLNQHEYEQGEVICAVATITMVVNTLEDSNLVPDGVRKYMTQEKYYEDGVGVLKARGYVKTIEHYGLQCKGCSKNKNDIENALLSGHLVIAAVSCTPFIAAESVDPNTLNGAYHSLLLHDYSLETNQVYVEDTFTEQLSGWYPLDWIIEGSARYKGLVEMDGPFFEIYE